MPKIDIYSDTLKSILYLSSYQMYTSMRKLSLLKAKGISQQFVKFERCSRASSNSDHGKSSTDKLIYIKLHHTFTAGVMVFFIRKP